MATKKVALYENKIENHKTINSSIVSYEIYVPPKKKKKKKKALPNGVRQVENDYESDTQYSAYPGEILIYNNQFKNKHWFPALDNDFGKLWVYKNGMKIPDIAYDGILPEDYYIQGLERLQNVNFDQFVFQSQKLYFVYPFKNVSKTF